MEFWVLALFFQDGVLHVGAPLVYHTLQACLENGEAVTKFVPEAKFVCLHQRGQVS